LAQGAAGRGEREQSGAMFDLGASHLLIGCAVSLVGAMVAVGAGIGGGPIYLPAFILMFKDAHAAVPLSKVNICAVAVAALFVNARRRHPLVDRPLINFDLALLMEPITLLGTVVGVSANVLLPSSIILCLCVIVLLIIVFATVRSGIEEIKWENEERNAEKDPCSSARVFETKAPRRISKNMSLTGTESRHASKTQTMLKERLNMFQAAQRVKARERAIPWRAVLSLTVLALGGFTLEYGGGGGLAVICGGLSDWLLLGASVVVELGFTAYWARHLWGQSRHWASCGVTDEQIYGDSIDWRGRSLVAWLGWSLVAGVVAGSTGIGGGLVKGPVMLHMGVHPSVATATSSFMILFTAFSSAFQFWVLGLIRIDYAIMFSACAFLGAFIGQKVVIRLEACVGRSSFVTFLLVFAIALSIIGVLVAGILQRGWATADVASFDVCSDAVNHWADN